MVEPLWTPSKERASSSLMWGFLQQIRQQYDQSIHSYDQLYDWSINQPGLFWQSLADYCDLQWAEPPGDEAFIPGQGMLGAKWFPKARLNFARNLIPDPQGRVVLKGCFEGQSGVVTFTDHQLWNSVAICAGWLKDQGIGYGDRVSGVVANTPEAIILMLATTSLGAIWSSCSPDFGVDAICERLGQLEPKLVFYTPVYSYNGKDFDIVNTIDQCRQRLAGTDLWQPIPLRYQLAVHELHCWQGVFDEPYLGLREIDFVATAFDHPVYIAFSSGTTGKPKCIVHGVGGTLLQHKKELMLHCDLKPGKSLLYFTTCGWMMWNWMASALGVGACVVTYDGSPGYPSLQHLWDLVAKEEISVFGTSPKFLSSCEKSGLSFEPKAFESLDTILSTGAPLSHDNFAWLYRDVKSDLQVSSISGGTDILSCFMLGNPLLPVYSGEIQCRGLGMAVEAWSDEGQAVVGQKAELVCTKPFVSMPVCFWRDDQQKKYRQAYFERFLPEEVWCHGDYIQLQEHGGIIVFGRSDATLNPGGVRIGTAEIYRVVEGLECVEDSLAIAVPSHEMDLDVEIWLFLRLRSKETLTESLKSQVQKAIRQHLSPRHCPQVMHQVEEIPYTRSGKKLELLVGHIIRGTGCENLSAVSNPQCLEAYEDIGKQWRAMAQDKLSG